MISFRLVAAGVAAASCLAMPAEGGKLETLVVTATRVPTAPADLAVPVIVIDREAIERSGAQDLAQILRLQAGIDIGRNGGPGQTASVFVRGAESNHTLVLIDGVRMNPGTIGGAAVQNVRPEIIERIEIVKGNRSSLYGSEAIGGVINVITRPGAERLAFSVGAGRYGSREASVAAAGRGERVRYDIAAVYGRSDGFPARVGTSEDSGHDNLTVNGGLRLDAGTAELGARAWWANGTTQYADFFGAPVAQDYTNAVVAVDLAAPIGAAWHTRIDVSHTTDDIEQRESSDIATTRRLAVDWQNTFALGSGHDLVVGLYTYREDAETLSFGSGFDEDTGLTAIYVEDNLQRGAHNASVAARFTDHDSFGSQTTWHLDYAYALNDSLSLFGALSSGFRAPDATDRFGFGGNPDLAPEVSDNLEAGVVWRIDPRQRLTFNAFALDIDDLIVFDFDPVTFAGRNRNIAEASVRGLEAAYRFEGERWSVRGSAVVQHPQNEATGEPLPRRARRSLSATVARRAGPCEVAFDVLATAERKDSDFSTDYNAGYVLAGLSVRRDLGRGFEGLVRLDNLLDADYQTARDFNTPGRGLYLTLRYRGH